MNIEEKAFLANIATILVKDIGIDRDYCKRKFPNILRSELESDDELDLFIHDMQKKHQKQNVIKRKHQIEKISKKFGAILKLTSTFSDLNFERIFHVTKTTYENLSRKLAFHVSNSVKFETNFIPPQLVVCLGLIFLLSDKEIFENVLNVYQIDENECYKIVPHFYNNIVSKFNFYVKWSKGNSEETKFLRELRQKNEGRNVKNVFGIIGCKKLNINFQSDEVQETKSIVVQITCNVNQIISSVEIEYASLYNFNNTNIGKCILSNSTDNLIPQDYYLIGDLGFPLNAKLITPFGNANNETKQTFNNIINNYVNILETVFEKIVQRFWVLLNLKVKDLDEFKNIFKSICVIHNLCFLYQDTCELQQNNIKVENVSLQGDEDDMSGLIKRQTIMDCLL